MKAAIFDLDGTLLDSMGVWDWVDRVFFERRGQTLPPDYGEAVAGLNFYGTACYTIERFGLDETPEQLMAEWQELAEEAYRERIPLKPFAKEYLQKLRREGVRLALATASDECFYRPALARHGVLEWFDAVALVNEVSRGKEFPDVYELAAKRLGVDPSDCVVFEDLPLAVRGAKAGGFYTVGVADESAKAKRAEMEAVSDRFVDGFEELLTSDL